MKQEMANPFDVLGDIEQRQIRLEALINEMSHSLTKLTNKPTNPKEWLTRKQAKEEFKISFGTLHNWMATGKLEYSKAGRKTLYRRSDLEKCLISKKGGASC